MAAVTTHQNPAQRPAVRESLRLNDQQLFARPNRHHNPTPISPDKIRGHGLLMALYGVAPEVARVAVSQFPKAPAAFDAAQHKAALSLIA